jgi:hypothetical protein
VNLRVIATELCGVINAYNPKAYEGIGLNNHYEPIILPIKKNSSILFR